jgi:hypothetical protein
VLRWRFDTIDGAFNNFRGWQVTNVNVSITKADCPDCLGDLNGDGVVDVSDLLALLGDWGPCSGACPGDLNSDGVVDVSDLLLLLGAWGACE